MAKELEKVYDPKSVEDRTYAFWQEGGFFHAKVDPEKKPYTIVIPPPTSPDSSTWATPWTRPFRMS